MKLKFIKHHNFFKNCLQDLQKSFLTNFFLKVINQYFINCLVKIYFENQVIIKVKRSVLVNLMSVDIVY